MKIYDIRTFKTRARYLVKEIEVTCGNEFMDCIDYVYGMRQPREYKESKDYTCEKCGLKVSNRFDRMYIHCHHKDGDKLNNDFSNLQCLCIKCHSQVNERHKENFSKGTNKLELEEFEKKYNTD